MIREQTDSFHDGGTPCVTDGVGRTVDYLRISVTDACNLRCIYCTPGDAEFTPPEQLLQDDEISRLVRIFSQLGFRHFRLTGGEPTVRSNITGLVRRLSTKTRRTTFP